MSPNSKFSSPNPKPSSPPAPAAHGGSPSMLRQPGCWLNPLSPPASDGRERGKDGENEVLLPSSQQYGIQRGGLMCSQNAGESIVTRQVIISKEGGEDAAGCSHAPTKEKSADILMQDYVQSELVSAESQQPSPTSLQSQMVPQADGALSSRRSWAEVVAEGDIPISFCFTAQGLEKRVKTSQPKEDDCSTFSRVNDWILDNLETMCKLSHSESQVGVSAFPISVSKEKVLNAMYDFQKYGVICYFMGQPLKVFQLHAWARAALGDGAVKKFIFLGKGFYIALCSEAKFKLLLVEKGGVWGNGQFAMVMPWSGVFDPMQALLQFCHVWVSLKEVPVILLPFVSELAAALGKVLYVPNLNSYVISRNIRICVLWCMDNPIPGKLKIDMGLEDTMYVDVEFSSFPNACYKCHKVGHYAKLCKAFEEGQQPNLREIANDGLPTLNQEEGNKEGIISVESPILISLVDKGTADQLGADSNTCSNNTTKDLNLRALSDVSNTVQAVTQKKKPKKKRKIKKLEEISENKELVSAEITSSKLEEEAKEDTDCNVMDVDLKKREPKGGEVTKDITDQKDRERINDTEDLLDSKAREQLTRVHTELHQFYNKETHFFELPAVLISKSNGDRYFLFSDGQQYEEEFFLNQFNIEPSDICIIRAEE